jgi:sugar-specific transcriptional regulator TrmB
MQEYYLKELGFTESEERIYVALLKLGSTTTGKIAKESSVSRSKLYEILEKLVKKGIVSHFKKNNVSYFTAAPPSRIIDYLKNKEETLKKQTKEFEGKMSFFENLSLNQQFSQEAQIFEGVEGIKNVREIALKNSKAKDIFYYFGNPASGHQNVLGYWDDWNARRIKKKIISKIVYNQDAIEFGERRKKQPYTQVKYLPKKGNTPAWVEIYGDIVAIAMKYDKPMSIVINNKFVAESFRMYFEVIWNASLNSVK